MRSCYSRASTCAIRSMPNERFPSAPKRLASTKPPKPIFASNHARLTYTSPRATRTAAPDARTMPPGAPYALPKRTPDASQRDPKHTPRALPQRPKRLASTKPPNPIFASNHARLTYTSPRAPCTAAPDARTRLPSAPQALRSTPRERFPSAPRRFLGFSELYPTSRFWHHCSSNTPSPMLNDILSQFHSN